MRHEQVASGWDYYSNPEFIAYKIREAVKAYHILIILAFYNNPFL